MDEGLKLVQVWVPDRNSQTFLADIQRQCAVANADPHRTATLAWLEGVQKDFVSNQPDFDWTTLGIDPNAPEESEISLA
jgi:hypothetical protein